MGNQVGSVNRFQKPVPSPGLVAAGDVPTAFPVLRGVVLRTFIFPYNSLFSQ